MWVVMQIGCIPGTKCRKKGLFFMEVCVCVCGGGGGKGIKYVHVHSC